MVEPTPAENGVTGGSPVYSGDETQGFVWLIDGTHDFVIGLAFDS